eukprot:3025591-Pyramimonas_sp.AAC.1
MGVWGRHLDVAERSELALSELRAGEPREVVVPLAGGLEGSHLRQARRRAERGGRELQRLLIREYSRIRWGLAGRQA